MPVKNPSETIVMPLVREWFAWICRQPEPIRWEITGWLNEFSITDRTWTILAPTKETGFHEEKSGTVRDAETIREMKVSRLYRCVCSETGPGGSLEMWLARTEDSTQYAGMERIKPLQGLQ